MNLEKTFGINQEQKIIENINNIPLENCINNFTTYLTIKEEETSNFSSLELDFLNELKSDSNLANFIWKLESKKIKSNSKEELIEKIRILTFEGSRTLDDCYTEDLLDIIEYKFNDADIYQDLKEYMLTTFNNLLKQKKLTRKEEELNACIKRIEYNKSAITSWKKQLEDMEINLKKDEETLKELKINQTENE